MPWNPNDENAGAAPDEKCPVCNERAGTPDFKALAPLLR